ncbi:hypothetical protein PZN02_003431 [Sinorhizobium garamanticum]|uniref:Phasin protein n=1 Tax=Sinorhizobium garamanticum TaxID=680247 RepID=A0ABY8D885_9HYPH|nr:hypothetical protein [Sinorhizobium garamanticum]WEX87084.1 hypothetical protein PZN02_003431 [Sinorhizobium garamanticum]
MIANATSLLASAKRIGITLDLYSHVMSGMQANTAEHVDAAIKAAKKPAVE